MGACIITLGSGLGSGVGVCGARTYDLTTDVTCVYHARQLERIDIN
jgi:hypothetical protein